MNEKVGFFSVADACEVVAEGCPNGDVAAGLLVALVVAANEKGALVAVGVVAEAGAPGVLKENGLCDDAAG